jgi:hypothetical protein
MIMNTRSASKSWREISKSLEENRMAAKKKAKKKR